MVATWKDQADVLCQIRRTVFIEEQNVPLAGGVTEEEAAMAKSDRPACLAPCRNCDEPIACFAKVCPSCGTKRPTRCIWMALLVMVALCLTGYGFYVLWNS